MSEIRKALEKENVSEEKIKEELNALGIKDSKSAKKYVGQKYRVIESDRFEIGEIVELIRVEEDRASLYRNSGGEEWFLLDADNYPPHVEQYISENETEIKELLFGIEL